MLKLHLFLIPLLYVICIFSIPLPAAWGYPIDHSGSPPLLIRKDAPPSTRQLAFTIQDNLNLFSKPNSTAAILLPVSDNFIAADTIDSNLPVFSLFRNPVGPSRDPLADVLYANLRIKKILQEYAELQDRAKMLLNSSYQSGTMNLMTGTDTNPRSMELKEENSRKADNLSRALRLLQQNLSATAKARDIVVYGANPPSPDTVKNRNPIISLNELQNILNKKKALTSTIQNKTSGSFNPTERLNSQPQAGTVPNQATSRQTTQTTYSGSGEIHLPWVLDLPFKLFDFAIAHKFISLMLGLFCLMFLNIIFGGRS